MKNTISLLERRWKIKWSFNVGEFYNKRLGGGTYSEISGYYVRSHNSKGVSIFDEGKKDKSFLLNKHESELKEITLKEFKEMVSLFIEMKNTTIKKSEPMLTKSSIYLSGNKILRTDGTFKAEVIKEVFLTRTIKVNGVEREVSVAVLIDGDCTVYSGYSVKNPVDKRDNALGKQIARSRAVNEKTNLTRSEGVSVELANKYVLRGIADMVFADISKGKVELKGVK